jgi:uncharacterized protein YecT (DUF1311 family)
MLFSAATAQETPPNCIANQAAMNDCAAKEAEKSNLERAKAFGQLLTVLIAIAEKNPSMGYSDIPIERAISAENAWAEYRNAECDKVGAISGGSLGIMQRSHCKTAMNTERAQKHQEMAANLRVNRVGIDN